MVLACLETSGAGTGTMLDARPPSVLLNNALRELAELPIGSTLRPGELALLQTRRVGGPCAGVVARRVDGSTILCNAKRHAAIAH